MLCIGLLPLYAVHSTVDTLRCKTTLLLAWLQLKPPGVSSLGDILSCWAVAPNWNFIGTLLSYFLLSFYNNLYLSPDEKKSYLLGRWVGGLVGWWVGG